LTYIAHFKFNQEQQMRRAIKGLIYDTETAVEITELADAGNHYPRNDFRWHLTSLYRTKSGRYFIAGRGGALSPWATASGNGRIAGEGVRPLTMEEARQYAEDAEVAPEAMAAAGFPIEEA
jgi:hypothetical protein